MTVDELLSGKQAVQPTVTLVPEEKRKSLDELMFRIVVDSSDGDKVRVNLPLKLLQIAMEMGVEMPQVSSNDALKNINWSQILQLVEQGAIGNLVEVESSDGDTVRIFVE